MPQSKDYSSTQLEATFVRFEDGEGFDPRTGRPKRNRVVMRQPSADFDIINVSQQALQQAGLNKDDILPYCASKLSGVRQADLELEWQQQYSTYAVRYKQTVTF